MKKLFAISLLLIHMFNVAGYRLLFTYFIHQSDSKACQQFDLDLYNDKDLSEVKIPLNLPYLAEMSSFERVDGAIEFQGIQYNYVKRKVSKDTLYILFHPNYAKTKLVNEKTNYAGNINDVPLSKKSPVSPIKKDFNSGEYNRPYHEYGISKSFSLISLFAQPKSIKLPTVFYPAQGEPPKQNCS